VRSRRAAATFAMFLASFPRRAMMASFTLPATESCVVPRPSQMSLLCTPVRAS
jgi:hypothetical protein